MSSTKLPTQKLELRRIHVTILADDYNKLRALYPRGGFNRVIRKLVNEHVRSRFGPITKELSE